METVIVKGLSFAYPESEYKALFDISFTVNKGEFCLVTGESAAGKSTLLKLLKKEIAPKGNLDGDVKVIGSAGYVSQNVNESIVCDKVRSELSFGLTNMGLGENETELLCAETASYFNFEEKLDSDISSLSGGEKQMVNLASVMIMKPDLLILDEPCSQLDPIATERFINVVKKLHKEFGITVIMSEHSSEEIMQYADSLILLESGKLLIKDSFENVLDFVKRTNNKMLSAFPVKLRYSSFEPKEVIKKEIPEVSVKINNLFFAYEKNKPVISGLNLDIYSGCVNAVIGPNSSGKTTLLKLISGVKKKTGGRIKTEKSISMLPQNVFDLFTKDTCEQEVAFGKNTDYLGISDIKKRHPYDLSGGQAQRLALAKVLETGADIILLDEPTKGLDAVLKEKLGALLEDLCKEGKTVVIVTHDIDFAGEYADFVSFLSRGRIVTTKDRRSFFSSLTFYTTSLSKLTDGKCAGVRDIL